MNERTTIPLWAVIVSIPTFVGFIFWLTSVASTTAANASDIKEIKEDRKVLIQIKEDVAFIKGKMEQEK